MSTKQMEIWAGIFGKEYTDRNAKGMEYWDQRYLDLFGTTRTEMNKLFLGEIDIENIKILEVGCNVGEQLRFLQSMGAKHLYAIELQAYAVEKAKETTIGINIIQGQGDDIPFKDDYFDLVFTSGVLIHIAPENLDKVMNEMVRCSKKYIWGMEYFSETFEEIAYGEDGTSLCWKGNYAKRFTELNADLEVIKIRDYNYIGTEKVDQMYLLRK